MNSVQENKNELEAAVRYCESAISRAQATIESMEFRQQAASQAWREQTGREAALERELEERISEVADLKMQIEGHRTNMALMTDENVELEERNDELNSQIVEQKGREAALEREVTRLKGIIAEGNNIIDEGKEDRETLVKNVQYLREENERLKREKEASSGQCGCQGYRDLEEDRARAEGEVELLQREIATLNDQLAELSKAYKDSTNEEVTMKKAWREQRELVALKDDQIAMLERRLAKHTGEKTYPFKEGDLYYVFNQLDGTWLESVWDDESERIHDTPSLPDHPHKVYFTIDQKNVIEKFNSEND